MFFYFKIWRWVFLLRNGIINIDVFFLFPEMSLARLYDDIDV
jgi:hypothetical protein